MRPTINLVKWKVFSLCFGFEGTISSIQSNPKHCRFSENLWWLRKRVYNLSKLVFLNYQVPFINFKFEVVCCDSRGFKANGIILSILSQVKVTCHDYSLKHWYSNSWNAYMGLIFAYNCCKWSSLFIVCSSFVYKSNVYSEYAKVKTNKSKT